MQQKNGYITSTRGIYISYLGNGMHEKITAIPM